MDFEIVTKVDIHIAGLWVELTASQRENYWIIRRHWQHFNKQLQKRNLTVQRNWQKYGVFTKVNGTYLYLSAIPAKGEIAGFENLVIAGGQFAKFCHKGSLQLIRSTVHNIYRNILPQSSLKIDVHRSLKYYEHNDYRFHWDRSDSIIEIFVPVADQLFK